MISETTSIIDAMNVINNNGYGIALICEGKKLLAVVSDSDIRRHILRNGKLTDEIRVIANYSPHYIRTDSTINYKQYLMNHHITALPVIDFHGEVVGIKSLYSEAKKYPQLNCPVVIMAGGKGSRLYPYTDILPKPLIPIGDLTITEHIMSKFKIYGCHHFDMIVNYKKHLIKSFFLDNEQQHNIDFIEETEFLGTGGGLKLLEHKYEEPFFMTNCDIIVDADYSEIMKYHKEESNIITMVAAMKNITIPYGTINVSDSGNVINLTEKPNFSFMTNTGLYVISQEFLSLIPSNTFIHITDIIQHCIDVGKKVGVYPISEDAWMDMGQMSELMKMKERIEV